jgi:enoyl-CoA hydratase
MADVVRYEVADRVATITLNRPEARNALSSEVLALLPDLARRADGDDNVDVVILTGADPAFCAGLDLKELGSTGGSLRAERSEARTKREDRPDIGSVDGRPGPFPSLAKPVIGAINGVAVTGGFELALACDFLVASERARFADTHARIGVQPGWGLTVLLPQAVGVRRARELSTTGNFLDARTALAWGLVNHVVDHDELLPFCRRLAADIASNDQAGVRRILRTYAENEFSYRGEGWRTETRAAGEWLRSGGGRPEEVEARRRAVMERGRAQTT